MMGITQSHSAKKMNDLSVQFGESIEYNHNASYTFNHSELDRRSGNTFYRDELFNQRPLIILAMVINPFHDKKISSRKF
jgi:hypothetical protein